jgi:hyperosmotically inducible periplasmic protein
MKANQACGLAVAALIVVTSTAAWSQTGDTGGASAVVQGASTAAPTGRKADRALRRKIYSAIAKDKTISAGDIGISTKDGAVTLNGTVTEAAQIGKVEQIARGVPGVTSVTNKLTVKRPFGGM